MAESYEMLSKPKKRKVTLDQEDNMRIHENAFVKLLEDTMKRVLGASAAPVPAAASLDHAQTIRSEVRDNIREVKIELMQLVDTVMEKMQAEAISRVDAMLQTVVQMLKNAPATESNKTELFITADTTLGTKTRAPVRQGQQQPLRAAQQSWAAVASTGTQKTLGWTTVTHGKKKAKKHSLDQRCILFARNVQSHTCDPRDIMFEVNKTLAHAQANVTVRVIKMGYTFSFSSISTAPV
jgi:hypothetical protein